MFRELIPTCAIALAVVFEAGARPLLAADVAPANTLQTKLAALQPTDRSKLTEQARSELIERHKALSNEYANDPQSAEAMLRVAELLGWENASKGVKSDLPAAYGWYRKAADRAVVGSDVWIQAKMTHAQMLHFRGEPGGPEQIECRRLLEEIERATAGNQFAQARVTLEFVRQSHWEGNVEAAERYCKKLKGWPLPNPADAGYKKFAQALPQWQLAAALEVMAAWVNTLGPKDTVAANVSRVAQEYAQIDGVQAYADNAIRQLATRPPAPPFMHSVSIEQPLAHPNRRRQAFIIINVVVILVIAVIVLRNWWVNSASSPRPKMKK